MAGIADRRSIDYEFLSSRQGQLDNFISCDNSVSLSLEDCRLEPYVRQRTEFACGRRRFDQCSGKPTGVVRAREHVRQRNYLENYDETNQIAQAPGAHASMYRDISLWFDTC